MPAERKYISDLASFRYTPTRRVQTLHQQRIDTPTSKPGSGVDGDEPPTDYSKCEENDTHRHFFPLTRAKVRSTTHERAPSATRSAPRPASASRPTTGQSTT